MAPPTDDPLQGLNSIPQPQSSAASLSDSQDLLAVPPYSDLAAQLDLWTHISFASDEPFVAGHEDGDGDENSAEKKQAFDRESGGASEEIKRKRQLLGGRRLADHPRPDTFTPPAVPQTQPTMNPQLPVPQPLDLQNLFALAAMSVAPAAPDMQNMNLQNLLALSAYSPFFQQQPAATGLPTFNAPAPISAPVTSTPIAAGPSAAKKPRARKPSTSGPPAIFTASPDASADKSTEPPSPMDESPSDTTPNPNLTPAEDKRRRNTQASARFRLKKKEREAAMETRCRELEAKVGELERECEALRRENGWLKGLVVGVTGGTQMPVMPSSLPGLNPAPASSTSSSKRLRDDPERQ